jgi:hypothetical protein
MDDQFLKGRYTSDCKVRNSDWTKAYNYLLTWYMHGLSLEFEKFLTVVQLFLHIRCHLPTSTSHERNYWYMKGITCTHTINTEDLLGFRTNKLIIFFCVYIVWESRIFSWFCKTRLNRFPHSAYYQEKVIQVKIFFTEMKSDIQNGSACCNIFCCIR